MSPAVRSRLISFYKLRHNNIPVDNGDKAKPVAHNFNLQNIKVRVIVIACWKLVGHNKVNSDLCQIEILDLDIKIIPFGLSAHKQRTNHQLLWGNQDHQVLKSIDLWGCHSEYYQQYSSVHTRTLHTQWQWWLWVRRLVRNGRTLKIV